MSKKIISGIMLTLLLTGTLTLAFNIQSVKASQGLIYIKPDGTIDPPSAQSYIVRDGDTYRFLATIWDYDGIVVQKSDIIIDGMGYELRGSGREEYENGFELIGVDHVTIQNTNIKYWFHGIHLDGSSYISISGNIVTGDCNDGIILYSSSYNNISDNTIINNQYGVFLVGSSSNDILWNNITLNGNGVDLYEHSDLNTISYSTMANNTDHAIYIQESSGNIVIRNDMWYNGMDWFCAIWLCEADGNSISSNFLEYNGVGIGLQSSDDNIIATNDIYTGDCGIGLLDLGSSGTESHLNTIYGNVICENSFGVYLRNSSSNSFYHNKFTDNTEQVYDDSWDNPEIPPSVNTWDDDYPSGGNHWSDHTIVDEYHGSNQDQPGGDGIADIPYVIDDNNEDRYPLTRACSYWVGIDRGFCSTEGVEISVSLTKDGLPAGDTPQTFTDLRGTHIFTVPDRDPHGHPFKEWSTGETDTTLVVPQQPCVVGGVVLHYTVYYGEDPIDVAFGSMPIADGSISAGEYLDANSVTFATSGGTSTAYFKHDGATLSVAFDVPNVDADSAVQLFVDTEYDRANAPQTDDHQFTITIDGELRESQGSGIDWDPPSPPQGWTATRQMFAGTWVAEFAIPYEKLGITAGVPKTIGISFWNVWTSTGSHSWPTFANWLDPSTWGEASSHNNWTMPVPRAWTCLAYIDADIDFEIEEVNQFLEMATVGSTPDVNIVVQMDRQPFFWYPGGDDQRFDDWTNCRQYLVTSNMTPTTANALHTLGEVNMGDPNTLANFIAWGILNYPADHYILVLLDHGGGWKGVCKDVTNDFDWLTPMELKEALAAVESAVGVKIDIVGFDACLMGMIEMAYQIKDHADIMVASEEVEPASLPGGWPYDYILGNLTSNPWMTPSELASQIVTSYIDSYAHSTHSGANKTTMSAVNLGLVPPTVEDLAIVASNFAQELINAIPNYWNAITQARNQTEEYNEPTYIDLYNFTELVHTLVSDPDIQTAAEQVMNTLTDAVIAEGHHSQHPNSHGLSIYFPQGTEDYDSSYEDLAFATHTKWDEFLNLFLYGWVEKETHVQIGEETYIIMTRSNITVTDVTASRTTLHFTASGTSGQLGYVNTTIPVGLNKTEIEVFIDGEPVTPPFPIITLNGTHYFIYFEFTLSTHDITIQYAIADITITNITPSQTVVEQGYCMNLTATVANLGSCTETFNVTAYADLNAAIIGDEITIGIQNVTLASEGSTTVTFTWNTTGVEAGDYTISAEASVVPCETDTTDNTKIDDTVTIIVLGHDVAIKNITTPKTVVGQNYSLTIYVTAKNYGTFTETFNVTVYYDSNVINYTTVTNLPPGQEETITFTWNTTGFAKGNYTIKVVADTVQGETDTEDNTLIDGTVLVGVPCDVTGPTPGVPDGVCNMRDINFFCNYFTAHPGDPRWELAECRNCDVTGPTPRVPDETVNMRDIGEACDNFMKEDP